MNLSHEFVMYMSNNTVQQILTKFRWSQPHYPIQK